MKAPFPGNRRSAAIASFVAVAVLAALAPGCSDEGGFEVGAIGELELRPAAIEFLSDATALGESRSLIVDVANTGTGPVTITALALTPDDAATGALAEAVAATFGATLTSPQAVVIIAAGDSAPLTVTYTRRDDEPRTLTLTLALHGARAAQAVLPIRVRRGEARLAANPSTARFEAGSDLTSTTVTVLNVGTRTLWLDRMQLRGDGSFTASLGDELVDDTTREVSFIPPIALPPGTSKPLEVGFLERSATPVEAELLLFGDAPNTLDGFIIPLLGNDTEPCVVARPPKVTFGAKSPDTTNDIPVEVENCGHGPAAITNILFATASDAADPAVAALGVSSASSERFSLVYEDAGPDQTTPWTLAPGEIRSFAVRYHSASASAVPPGAVVDDVGFVLVRADTRLPLRVIEVTGATRGELPPSLCELTELPSVAVDPTCLGVPRPGTLEPAVRWEHSIFETSPAYGNVMMTPVVGNLTDDNGDGRIDASDIADIVITRFTNGGYGSPGVLTALSGDDGRELWSITSGAGAASVAPFGIGGVALGDLDANGRPEICVQLVDHSLACYEAVGSPSGLLPEAAAPGSANLTPGLRFEAPGCAPPPVPTLGLYPAIADLDGDGKAEVMFHGCVFAHDGTLIARIPTTNSESVIPFAANLDADPALEIIDGGFVYDSPVVSPAGPVTLVQIHDLGLPGARDGIGDFDGDGRPEIVASHWQTRTLRLYDPDGSSDPDALDGWQVIIPESNSPNAGGPPTIADFDGDGELEIGIASELGYVAFDTDGTVLWTQPAIDQSSRQTGSSVFDFDGDGAAEVLYADEEDLRIFDGATGGVRFVVSEHGSGTGVEYPVIADLNRDGRAEIVLASNNYYRGPWNGIHVLAARDDTWSSAPPVWNQHAYGVININPDLSVPRIQAAHFKTFRAAEWGDASERPDADLQLAAVDLCPFGCDASGVVTDARVHFQIGNGGLLPASGSVAIREGSATGPMIAMSLVPEIASGGVFTFETTLNRAVWADRTLVAVVSIGQGTFDCRGDNDVRTLGTWPWETPVQCR